MVPPGHLHNDVAVVEEVPLVQLEVPSKALTQCAVSDTLDADLTVLHVHGITIK